MCECLVSFSTWVENNSGQIQIVIAFGAIWLAFAGYKKYYNKYIFQQNRKSRQRKIDFMS